MAPVPEVTEPSPRAVVPSRLAKLPAMKTFLPFGLRIMACTLESAVGAQLVSVPVSFSTAARLERATPPTLLNFPPK